MRQNAIVAGVGMTRFGKFLGSKTFARECTHKRLTRVWRIADQKFLYNLFAQAALFEHVFHSVLVPEQTLLVILRRKPVRFEESFFALGEHLRGLIVIKT